MGWTAPRLALTAALAMALTAAVYLYAVRGPALLIDLAAATRGFLCF